MDSHSSDNASDLAVVYRQPENISVLHRNSSNALHVAAALNLPTFTREIVKHSPELAVSFDEHGLTPCHLAVANGHIYAVKELLYSKVGPDICSLRDKGGFLPIHTAVMKGRVNVLKVVTEACHMWMLREPTWQGDNILHLTLKFDKMEAFRYLWHLLRWDTKLINSGDAEGNTLFHIAMAKRQQEIVKLLVGKVDMNAININGLTILDLFFNVGHDHGEMALEEIIRRADRRRESNQSPQIHITRPHDGLTSRESRTQPSSSKAGTNVLFQLRKQSFDFGASSSGRAPNEKDRETGNTLMVVATLIAAITFQSALNPPGGFIQDGEDRGMAVLEYYLDVYLLFDVMAFISSLSVILLTIYAIPKWKNLFMLAKFLTWVFVLFTFMSFQHAIVIIFNNVAQNPLILALIYTGDGVVLVFAFIMFIYSWYFLHKIMSTFLHAKSTKGMLGISMNIAIGCLAFLGAALVWLPIVLVDIVRYYT